MKILGISAYQHDASAALVIDGKVISAAAQERFDRIKYSSAFPKSAIDFCLSKASITIKEIDCIAYYMNYEKYFQWFLHEMGGNNFKANMQTYEGEFEQLAYDFNYRLNLVHLNPRRIRKELDYDGEILSIDHHNAHSASSFYCSPFREAAVMTLDAIGEWETATLGQADKNGIQIMENYKYPHSLGTVYKAITVHLGFHENDAGKVMGLSSYGDSHIFREAFEAFLEITDDGFRVGEGFLKHPYPARYWSRRQEDVTEKFLNFFGPPRRPNAPITSVHENIAAGLQSQLEKVVFKLCARLCRFTNKKKLCLAGGVALNSVMNGKLLQETPFEDVFVPPAAGDDGASIGAALYVYNNDIHRKKQPSIPYFSPYLGPEFSDADIEEVLVSMALDIEIPENPTLKAAEFLSQGKIVGWFQGRMEIGPRALGNRSILADPRYSEMKDIINAKVKFREMFRPFAPSCLEEKASMYFETDRPSPYMLFVCDVKKEQRSKLGAVSHVDGTARLQTINSSQNPQFYRLIKSFGDITGVYVVLNTSFNVKNEPIVNTPREAIHCFYKTQMDVLFLNNFMLIKTQN